MEIIFNKIESIKRCLKRIREEYQDDEKNLFNFTKQDSIILNLQRACELTIDIGNYIIAKNQYETPKTSRDVFEILAQQGVVSKDISVKLQRMVGFRNLAVHDYQELDIEILKSVIQNHLKDFEHYETQILTFIQKQ
ncbi:MAG TPA: hypothetical protein DHW82_03370 [Spirochaetia bacterium]|nr:MAG: hypothetical protein A2Y41_06580 [Spirochaetes bacterium GWB1_36_13]HCL56033.1 hypothetical protein [Spirochaetia bacterium]